VLVMNRMGIATVSSGGREQILREQEAILVMGNEPGSYYRPNQGHSLTIRVPQSMLRSIVADPDDSVMRLIPRNRSSLGLLSHYAGWLLKAGGSLDPELLKLSARHIQDLLALTLGVTSDFKEIAKTRGLRAARLKLSKAHIVAHSHRREISVGSVATHFCVTPRYLQRLFEEDGTTFSEFLVTQRLSQAHRRLCEPDCGEIPISTIAYDCGFGDLSYFNRRFRRAYGLARRGAKARCLDREFSSELAAMTSKTIVLKILDALIIAFLGVLALSLARLPLGWLPRLFHMSNREFNGFSIFVVSAAMCLMYAIASSDSAP